MHFNPKVSPNTSSHTGFALVYAGFALVYAGFALFYAGFALFYAGFALVYAGFLLRNDGFYTFIKGWTRQQIPGGNAPSQCLHFPPGATFNRFFD